MQNKSISLFVSSDAQLGAFNITSGNNRFDIQFKNTIEIPHRAKNLTLQLTQATIWWTVLNISVEKQNNLFRLIVKGAPDVVYDITIPDGLYSVSDLNNAINRELINQGLVSGLVILTPDNATGRVLLTLSELDLRIEWITGSMFLLTGFSEGQFVPAADFTTGAYSELAPNVAQFSDISSFLVHTTLLGGGGIPIGDMLDNVSGQVQITSPPGSLINFQPQNPVRLDVSHLAGTNINEAQFYITDQLNREVDFNSENFTNLIEIKWFDPLG